MSVSRLRYRAFLSYSHRDEAVVRALHRKLEAFRVPRSLRNSAHGRELPVRLQPVFRDRDELASSTQLSRSIEAALDESEALVVVCSPAASSSPWVGAEISYFRRSFPQRPIFAFVVGGDPGLDPRRDPEHAAFPLALLLASLDGPDGELGEPLAADARPEADGFASAFLKLVAGLLGVRFDDLRRRDLKRRQRLWIVAVGASILLAASFALLALQATRARDAARVAQARAELELRSEQQTREFLISVFRLADANEARGAQVTVREVLDRAVARIDRTEFDRPAIRARFLATLGQAYSSLGLNRRGVELLRESIQAVEADALDAEAGRQRIDSRIELADMFFDMGDYDNSLAALDAASGESQTSLQQAMVANVRGDTYSYLERDAESREAYALALAALDRVDTDPTQADAARARTWSGLATLDLFAGKAEAAEAGYRHALETLRRVLGEDHPRSIAVALSLGSAAYRNGNRDVARSVWQRALALAEHVFDPDSPQIGTLKNNLGLLLLEDGDLAAAEPLLRDALASDRRHRADGFDDLAYPLHNLGYLLLVQGHVDEARTVLHEGIGVALASKHRMLGPLLTAMADLECAAGESATGAGHAREALAVFAAASEGDADAWRVAQARLVSAYCLSASGDAADPAVVRQDLATLRARWPGSSPYLVRAQQHARVLQR